MIRQIIFFTFFGSLIATFLFQTSYMVHDLMNRKTQLIREIHTEKENIKILHAEWMHLNDPDRLQKLSDRFLDMQPITNAQIKSMKDIPGLISNTQDILRPQPKRGS